MYLRAIHSEHDLETLYDFILKNPLGIFTSAIPSPDFPTIQSSHIPWVLDIPSTLPSPDSDAPVATLRGHLARANPQAKALIEAITKQNSTTGPQNGVLEDEVLILFNGPVHHYVPPAFYIETKPSTGKVVPTWNYAAVQAYGKIKVLCDTKDSSTGKFLSRQMNDLTRQSEQKIMHHDGQEGRREAWTVNEAPEKYVELLKKAIIGVEIEVTRLGGKWKMSQESPEQDREGTIEGFAMMGTKEGSDISQIIRERSEMVKRKEARSSAK